RQLLSTEFDPRGQDRVLERVLAVGQLGGDETAFAGLTQPVEPLSPVSGRRMLLGLAQGLELLAGEEIRVARDDRGPLGDLLLAHTHGPALLGALEHVALDRKS